MAIVNEDYLTRIRARLAELEAELWAAMARRAPGHELVAIVEQIGEVCWQTHQHSTHVWDQIEAAEEERAAEDEAWRELNDSI